MTLKFDAMGTPHLLERLSPISPTNRSARRRRRKKHKRRVGSINDELPISLNGAGFPAGKLPVSDTPPDSSGALPSILRISEQFDPWREIPDQETLIKLYVTRIWIQGIGNSGPVIAVNMFTPIHLSAVVLEPLDIDMGSEGQFAISFGKCGELTNISVDTIKTLRRVSSTYFSTTMPKYRQQDLDYLVMFCAAPPHCDLKTQVDGLIWPKVNGGPLNEKGSGFLCVGHVCQTGHICDYSGLTPSHPPRVRSHDTLPSVQRIPSPWIPILVNSLERRLVAERLCTTVLAQVGFSTIEHILPAITTPYTRIQANYQRYEFFGDAVLKYIVSRELFREHPDWSEGHLSMKRDELVENPRLALAALALGLDAFVLDRRVNIRNWSAPTMSQRAHNGCTSRQEISANVLADVVEALIGAAYIDGGVSRACCCIQRLRILPEAPLQPIPVQTNPRDDDATGHMAAQDSTLVALQTSLEYTFRNPSLLVEALTHPSLTCSTATPSYQRLEFLGDAVLDLIIINQPARHPVTLTAGEMSLIKHALSNQYLLAFLCLEFPRSEMHLTGMWRFMRFSRPSIEQSQNAVLGRYLSLRGEILSGLYQAKEYPWQALVAVNADKYFSDLVESVLGAIFVDSSGDLNACEKFLEKIGLLRCLARILGSERVGIAHPKDRLQKLSRSLAKFTIKKTAAAKGSTANSAIYECMVTIRGVRVAVAESCLSREHAEVKAAAVAIQTLQETPLESPIVSSNCP
ncbi:ribonuclease III domain-containing protein [Aspergillus pseudoustus]|uniref:Ribonuclease III domain-containing protein n=1 Tax=Aspergillus pseudoustus TaxID=1810923 RepID=A0ABR4JSC0_9EURO